MIFRAVVENAQHPEYGVATIPFPIKREDYSETIALLEPLGIGDAIKRDCRIDEIRGDFPVLKQLEMTGANLDELDYLAKRLDSFDDYEMTQFQATASRFDLHGVDEMINLTFCCQEATVITDFSDLESLGRRHYLTMHEGGISVEEMEKVDGNEVAQSLIDYQVGRVTRYGVVYDNDMVLRQLYDGHSFPEYAYEASLLEIEGTPIAEPEGTKNTAFFLLPMAQEQIERTMLRAGFDTYADMRLRFLGSNMPEEIDVALDMEHENLTDLNIMCASLSKLSPSGMKKLGAVVSLAQPENSLQVMQLAENLDQFDFVPGVKNAEEYGRYMIRDSEHFDYDENLEEYYDYERYGRTRTENECGHFVSRGYVSYHGTLSLDELMMEDPSALEQSGFQMGGIE